MAYWDIRNVQRPIELNYDIPNDQNNDLPERVHAQVP